VHPSAVVEEGAHIDPSASIGAQCSSAARAHRRRHRAEARVTVGEDCVIGARGLIQSGAVIGGDGFGFAPDAGRWERSSSWARCASATTWRSAPTPASTAARWTTR
jgi:UDP-3-O-[3-hydroxymyristoyl] glucosamine N-acyltransferase